MQERRPASSPINYDSLANPLFPQSETCHEVIFEGLDGVVICDCCLKTDGAAGPSGIDAAGWSVPLSVCLLCPPNDSEQAMLALPIRFGGLGIFNLCKSVPIFCFHHVSLNFCHHKPALFH